MTHACMLHGGRLWNLKPDARVIDVIIESISAKTMVMAFDVKCLSLYVLRRSGEPFRPFLSSVEMSVRD